MYVINPCPFFHPSRQQPIEEERQTTTQTPHHLHLPTTPRTQPRVRTHTLPLPPRTCRTSTRTRTHADPNQNLVPKQTFQVQKNHESQRRTNAAPIRSHVVRFEQFVVRLLERTVQRCRGAPAPYFAVPPSDDGTQLPHPAATGLVVLQNAGGGRVPRTR